MKAIFGIISQFFGAGNAAPLKAIVARTTDDSVDPIPAERMHEVPDFGEMEGRLLTQAARLFPKNVNLRIKWLQAIGKMRQHNIYWVLGEVHSATENGKLKGTIKFDKWSSNNVAA